MEGYNICNWSFNNIWLSGIFIFFRWITDNGDAAGFMRREAADGCIIRGIVLHEFRSGAVRGGAALRPAEGFQVGGVADMHHDALEHDQAALAGIGCTAHSPREGE